MSTLHSRDAIINGKTLCACIQESAAAHSRHVMRSASKPAKRSSPHLRKVFPSIKSNRASIQDSRAHPVRNRRREAWCIQQRKHHGTRNAERVQQISAICAIMSSRTVLIEMRLISTNGSDNVLARLLRRREPHLQHFECR